MTHMFPHLYEAVSVRRPPVVSASSRDVSDVLVRSGEIVYDAFALRC